MTIFLIIVILITAVFLLKKRSKHRVINNMFTLADAAKLITACSLLNELESRKLQGGLIFGLQEIGNRNELAVVVAASTNHLFGEEPSAQHQSLELTRIHADAMR